MKQTQRAKDYPIIGELARLLPPGRELELTTDPDRILELAAAHGEASGRPAVVKARNGDGRLAVVRTLRALGRDALTWDDVRLSDEGSGPGWTGSTTSVRADH